MVLLIFGWIVAKAWLGGTLSFWAITGSGPLSQLYLSGAAILGLVFVFRWCFRKFSSPPKSVTESGRTLINVQEELGENLYRTSLGMALKRIPFNQSHLIAIERMTFQVANLPQGLDGLKICHLSDFHFTGQLDQKYFHRIVEAANAFEPDLVLITGDLIDEHECLDWIEPVFSRLEPKYSTWFVRGNHDVRIADQADLLERLKSAGLNWTGGKCDTIQINGQCVTICGNELPWFPGAEKLVPDTVGADSLRILLTHTPDQIDWVRNNGFEFDLILAGHNHGGQIALPFVGPIVAPSKYGVLYASGNFEIGNAIMHVSRGISGDECIRINCAPEIGYITLSSPNKK